MLKYDRFGDTDYNGAKCKHIALNINHGQKRKMRDSRGGRVGEVFDLRH